MEKGQTRDIRLQAVLLKTRVRRRYQYAKGTCAELITLYRKSKFLHLRWYIILYKRVLRSLLSSVFYMEKNGKESSPSSLVDLADFGRSSPWRRRLCASFTRKSLLKFALALLLVLGFYCFLVFTGITKHVDPHAVKGYSYCPVDEESVISFPRDNKCDFIPRPKANPSNVIVVTFVNSAWLSLAHNWICSAKKVGLSEQLYLVSFEPNVCSQFDDIPCYEHPGSNISGTVFGEPAYQRLVIERTRLILKFLSCGQRVALVDADITFLKNPLDYLNTITSDKDIVFQADSSGVRFIDAVLPHFFRYICGGFIYMKSNVATKRLWLSVLKYQETFKWNDQAGLNICIRHRSQNVTWDVLDPQHFPNGRQFFYYDQIHEDNMIVHANHLEGNAKVWRMMASEVWCDDHYAEQVCKENHVYAPECLSNSAAKGCKEFRSVCKAKFNMLFTS